MNTLVFPLLGVLMLLACAPHSIAAGERQTVIQSHDHLDNLNVPRNFGIFRNPDESPQVQAIVEKQATRKLSEELQVGFLQLAFVLRKPGAFNGWCLKPRIVGADGQERFADWSRFRHGELVLRIRSEAPH